MNPVVCEITRPFAWDETVDNFYTRVPVNRNPILKAIMEAKDSWYSSPIIWVDNHPYRIQIISQTKNQIILYQMALFLHSKDYGIINKRKVRIILN
jgi:hypothetical protein